MRIVELDFETRSECDLAEAGADAYAQHWTTEILCLCLTDPGGKARWFPGDDTGLLLDLISDPDTRFVAHNAAFEQAIWRWIMVRLYGLPPLPVERWDCTLAACAYKSIALALGTAGPALGVADVKDTEGNKLTLSMSKPLTKKEHMEGYPGGMTKKEWAARFEPGRLPDVTSEKLERIAAYCEQDVVVEHGVLERVGLLPTHERKVWMLDQTINQRGVRIDLEFVRQAQLVIDRASVGLTAEFRELTGGLNPGQVEKVIAWCATQGVALECLRKDYLADLLGGDAGYDDAGYRSNTDGEVSDVPTGPNNLPDQVARVLAIRQMLGSASVKKLARMRACVCDDGRARGLLQYHAAHPGRWGGRLLQPQNFPRGALKVDPEAAVDAILTGDPAYVEAVLGLPAIECVASSLRHALVADPGKVLEVGDFAGIEARIVLALAGQHDKTAMMAAGQDVYLDVACDIYSVARGTLTKADTEKRQTGKNTVLGCGFQMGAATFHDRYCPDQPVEFAEGVIQTYRKVWAPKVPHTWYGVEEAALRCVQTGQPTDAYGCVFRIEGDWLSMTLPSRWQKVWYFQPRACVGRFGNPAWSYSGWKNGKHQRIQVYGGLLIENAVQGLARGLLVASMFRLEQAGHPLILTVHDEAVCEVEESKADRKVFRDLMAEPTLWAREMQVPITVEEWIGPRYRK